MKHLSTEWGRRLDKAHVKPEYPRPTLERKSYLNLNGVWDCCIDRQEGCDGYDRTIVVPFAPEAALSGVGIVVRPEDILHYRRLFTLPEGFVKGRVLLHFGAVDQECSVFLNGRRVGGHQGGYLPFSLDITDALAPGENVLEVHVRDRTENAPYARGKQKLVKKGKYSSIFYTPCSGIWKTVWLESVPQQYVTGLRITPRYDAQQVEIMIQTNGAARADVVISLRGQTVYRGDVATDTAVSISLPGFEAWSPDTPTLYDVEIHYQNDCVRSYFGMRCFEKAKDKNGILRFYLNKKPFFFNGLLDQGYWSDGLLTAPSDAALAYDIRAAKALGYNTLRMHVKVEEERFYYLCDKLGMAVWQDMPNGGGDYNMFFVTCLPNAFDWFARGVRDSHYRLFKREDRAGREQFLNELKGMVSLLYHHPCIALWTPFNEGWGQFDARQAAAVIRAADPTRLINEACGWFDQGGGDLFSIHNYIHTLRVRPRKDRAVAVTEYGGYAYPVSQHLACEKEFGYQIYHSPEELTQNYCRLWEEEIFPNLARGLSAAIYTQLSDVEEEINGVTTFDRAQIKFRQERVCALHERLYRAYQDIAARPS